MNVIAEVYNGPLTLLTDFYQLTSAYAFWKAGKHETQTVYHMFHRSTPFGGGYSVAAGLQYLTDWVRGAYFQAKDLDYLSEQKGNDDKPLFEHGFLKYLEDFKFKCDIDAVPEGTVIFPHEPMVRVKGTVVENLLVETFCLNVINSQTLFATKASRVCQAAGSDPVLEFGLRRAQGIDGSIGATRAAFIGGCTATSNVFAGRLFNIPVKGTHPHGFVMFFDSEVEAFEEYAKALPNNCVFLVDTYNTLQGVKHAIEASLAVKAKGFKPIGIRLDSGDLAYLSIEARKLLDGAGLQEMKIFASNDLDEKLIDSLKEQGARIALWGVGTKMVTSYDQPAFGGVFKMGAIQKDGQWVRKIKLSEQAVKTSNPGILNFRRFYDDAGFFAGDMIYDTLTVPPINETSLVMVDPLDPTRRRKYSDSQKHEDGLEAVIRAGQLVGIQPSLPEIQARAKMQLAKLHPSIRRFVNPHAYPVGLELTLHELKTEMILKARGFDA